MNGEGCERSKEQGGWRGMTEAGHPVCRVGVKMERTPGGQRYPAGDGEGQSRDDGRKEKTSRYPPIHASRKCLLSTCCVPGTGLGTRHGTSRLAH